MVVATALAAFSVTLSSPVARPAAQVRVTVIGLHAPSALVVLHGGLAREGRWFRWVPLQALGGGRWSAVLRTPGFYGSYPVLVRANGVVRQSGGVLQVVPAGYRRQPGFDTPRQVAQWWAWLAHPSVALKRVSTCSGGFYTHRDSALNRLLRVDFRLLEDGRSSHLRRRLRTVYLSVARARPGGPWRLLEIVPAP